MDVATTQDGNKLLTASEDHTIRMWDTRTGKLEVVLSGHDAELNRIVVLPGDNLVVSAAEEPVVKVWDLNSGKMKFSLSHDSAVRELKAESNNTVRTVTLSGTSTIWDCSSGKRLEVKPKASEFPKLFGTCELLNENGTLQMRIVK